MPPPSESPRSASPGATPALGDFTAQAASYARARPGYPLALVEQLLAHAGVRAGDAVVDLGAGTGLFTRLLSGRGLRITAIEPGEAMRREAPALPGVTWQAGTFEATGLPAGSQAWAVAAQAFHWAQPAVALPEVRQILRPGAAFTILWNNRENDASPVLAHTQRLITQHVPEFDHGYRDGDRDKDWASVLTTTGDFTGVVRHEARHVVPMPVERFLELWRSHNRLTVTAGPVRFAGFLEDLRRYLAAERVSSVDVPYVCKAWTVRRA